MKLAEQKGHLASWQVWLLFAIGTALIVGALALAQRPVSADHFGPVTIFNPSDGDIYVQDSVVGWGIGCHAGYNCTRTQVPGGLDGFHLNTSVPCECAFIATATHQLTGEFFTVTHHFTVIEPFDMGTGGTGDVGPGTPDIVPATTEFLPVQHHFL